MITIGQGTAGPTAVRLFQVPPGPGAITLANIGTASPVYVGYSNPGTVSGSVSASNGFPLYSGISPPVIPLYAGNAAGSLSAMCVSGAASIAWIISTATGNTGF